MTHDEKLLDVKGPSLVARTPAQGQGSPTPPALACWGVAAGRRIFFWPTRKYSGICGASNIDLVRLLSALVLWIEPAPVTILSDILIVRADWGAQILTSER
jgi:hypothetical protein